MENLKYFNSWDEYNEYNEGYVKYDPTISFVNQDESICYDKEILDDRILTFTLLGTDARGIMRIDYMFTGDSSLPPVDLEFSPDGITWTTYTFNKPTKEGATGINIPFNTSGQTIKFRGSNMSFSSRGGYFKFVFVFRGTIPVKVTGDVTSLINRGGGNIATLTEYCFANLFENCYCLVQAPNLPSLRLNNSCYTGMFYGCTSLVSAPALPATRLANYCYADMFHGCTSLVSAPALPATTLATNCYEGMFSGCTSLTSAPALPATTLADYCYEAMFSGCTSLTSAPALHATTLADYCYSEMFYGCTSLIRSSDLLAQILFRGCYSSMFYGCVSLKKAPALPATTLTKDCYYQMFYGCTSLTKAPVLPATTLKIGAKKPVNIQNCYSEMFNDCVNLNYIKALIEEEPNSNSTSKWVKHVSPKGTFEQSSRAQWKTFSDDAIPFGWNVIGGSEIEKTPINTKTEETIKES